MSPLPCPYCKNPLALTLDFIVKHPAVQCPHCQTILNFKVDKEATEKMKKGLREIEDMKKKYSKIAKFG